MGMLWAVCKGMQAARCNAFSLLGQHYSNMYVRLQRDCHMDGGLPLVKMKHVCIACSSSLLFLELATQPV